MVNNVKACPDCGAVMNVHKSRCPKCGYRFGIPLSGGEAIEYE